jgi:hypothetical protein
MFIDASFRVAAAQNYRAQNYRANKKGDLTAVAATTTYSSRDLLMGSAASGAFCDGWSAVRPHSIYREKTL